MDNNNRNTGNWNSGYKNAGDWNSGNWNSGDKNSGDRNTGYMNGGDWNSGNWNNGGWNTGYGNSGDWNTGHGNSGDWNTGYGNSGDRNSGIFCSTESTVRIFNKQTNLRWDQIDHPTLREFYLTKWVPESEMTDEEKVANPTFFTTRGYLKEIPWEEAWATYWEKSDKEEKDRILNLPNFDPDIFKEITGIDVNHKLTQESKED